MECLGFDTELFDIWMGIARLDIFIIVLGKLTALASFDSCHAY